ncbi:putative dna binding regulatory protein [Botrytis fragariae]|uniref:Putative dna binding regulatory protein n=1 Tax=Botrytis fragariae TaxID=1964551 RepID=A0A8H6B0C5_9HELO|nr:putative dna binding regulatory protein [Botrytis fragariae]KAF5876815.1 putative dna binding regulatory protein [Botrytis fragariae]
MLEYDIYDNSSVLKVTPAANLGTPRISSVNSGYDPIQQNIKRRAYLCKTCQRSFSREIYLRRHKRIAHVEDNRIKCPNCAEYFTPRDLLIRHREEAHKKRLLGTTDICRQSPDIPKLPSHTSSTWLIMTSSPRNSRSNSFNSSTLLSSVPPFGLTTLNSSLDRFEMQGIIFFASGTRANIDVIGLRKPPEIQAEPVDMCLFWKIWSQWTTNFFCTHRHENYQDDQRSVLCIEENPCDTCPKRNKVGKTAWTQIGRKRGTPSEEMESIDLCPISYFQPMPWGIDVFCFQYRLSFTEGEGTITKLGLTIAALRQNMSRKLWATFSPPIVDWHLLSESSFNAITHCP